MKRVMKLLRLAVLVIFLIPGISSCKTVRHTKEVDIVPSGIASHAPRSVLFFPGEEDADILEAVISAHEMKLQLCVVFNRPDQELKITDRSAAEIKTLLKHQVSKLAAATDIDGIAVMTGGLSAEMIEHVFAESMLIKPYLFTCIIYNENDYQLALACLNEGTADMIIPAKDVSFPDLDTFTERIKLPVSVKRIKPEQVFSLDLSALFHSNPGGQTVQINNGNKTLVTDSEGSINFITFKSDTIELKTGSAIIRISTKNWFTPFRYSVQADGTVRRKSPWVEFRRFPGETTDVPEFDLLCKTDYPATVMINGIPVKQYKTGIFFNKLSLNEGVNRVRATVITSDSLSTFYEREIVSAKRNKTRKPLPLWIDKGSVEPAVSMELLQDDNIRINFKGSAGQEGFVKVLPGKTKIKCSRQDFEDYSVYMADLHLDKLLPGKVSEIILQLVSITAAEDIEYELPVSLRIRSKDDYPVVRVKNENSRITYNLGAPRLGGPLRSEPGPGVVLKTSGKIGDYYRIRLSSSEYGFIHADDIEVMPEGTVQPSYYITNMSCGPSSNADILSIPYPEPVPYEVFPEPDQKRIVITLFGVRTASTWITHMNNRKIIDKVTWQQTTPETYRIYVNLNTSDIWGYDLRQDGKRLLFSVKYPPVYDLSNEKPLSGLKIAIEAGHGGSGIGAVGLSGLPEKEINLDLSIRLGELCKSMGAEVVQVRDSDIDMGLLEKREIALKSGSDILVSIHANAGGRGYLSVAGTSTYWHNPFWAPLAEKIYDRLLELNLKEFGVIGSFNYTVTRVSQMPSVLVEQAFMSHAEDEEKLADPGFRQEMAQKILDGLIDYLKNAK